MFKSFIVLVLLAWVAVIAVLWTQWERLPAWVIGLMLLFEFAVVSDMRIFKLPFLSAEAIAKISAPNQPRVE